MATLVIAPAYGLVLLECVAIGFHVLLTGMSVMPVRKRVFTKEFFAKNFPELKKTPELGSASCSQRGELSINSQAWTMRYPDMGHTRLSQLKRRFECLSRGGQYAQKLPHDDWVDFANAQRVHYNYLEGAPSAITFLLVSGLFYARFTSACGAAYIVGRVLYSLGYKKKGAPGRLAGALTFDTALLGALGGATLGAFNLMGGFAGLKAIVGL